MPKLHPFCLRLLLKIFARGCGSGSWGTHEGPDIGWQGSSKGGTWKRACSNLEINLSRLAADFVRSFCGNFRKIVNFWDQFWVQNLVPKTGPHFWVLIGILLKPNSRSQKWVRFWDPFLGPFLDQFLAFLFFFSDLFRIRFWGPLNLPGHRQKEFAVHVALGLGLFPLWFW